jgi:glycosyltransferase involved in cell wall biosynthesis
MIIAPANTPNTGDYDYANLVSQQINKIIPCESVTTLKQLEGILRTVDHTSALIHVSNYTSKAQPTGSDFTPAMVKEAKKAGALYVFNPIEPIKIDEPKVPESFKQDYQNYYDLADLVVTHTDIENIFVQTKKKRDATKCKVIPIPQTVETIPVSNPHTKFSDDSRHVFHFGIIRLKKGIEESLEFSHYLSKTDPSRKVIIAGSIGEMSDENLIASLFSTRYVNSPTILEKIKEITSNKKQTKNQKLESFISLHHDNKNNKNFYNPNLDVFLNVSAAEMAELSNICSYALYNYHDKGLSERLSGFTNAMAGGLKVYSSPGYDTGNTLIQLSEEKSASCYLIPKNEPFQKYFGLILEDMKKLERNQGLANQTRKRISEIAQRFSPASVAQEFVHLFKKH